MSHALEVTSSSQFRNEFSDPWDYEFLGKKEEGQNAVFPKGNHG